MLATEPGAVLSELTVDGLPRIIRVATAYIVPLVDPYLPRRQGRDLIDVVARLVISYFLAPSATSISPTRTQPAPSSRRSSTSPLSPHPPQEPDQ